MGPKYNAATSLEELGSTKTYRRSSSVVPEHPEETRKGGNQFGGVYVCKARRKLSSLFGGEKLFPLC